MVAVAAAAAVAAVATVAAEARKHVRGDSSAPQHSLPPLSKLKNVDTNRSNITPAALEILRGICCDINS